MNQDNFNQNNINNGEKINDNEKKVIKISSIIIIINIILLVFIGIYFGFVFYKKHTNNHKKVTNEESVYTLVYQKDDTLYNIYKKNANDEVSVVSTKTSDCDDKSCSSKNKYKIEFSNNNMIKVTNFINSFFKNKKTYKVKIDVDKLSFEQTKILNSIIYNDDYFLVTGVENEKYKYYIITDTKWNSVQSDGSREDIYYIVDLHYKRVVKYDKLYHSNADVGRTTDEKIVYSRKINNKLVTETKNLLNELFEKEDNNENNNRSFYFIYGIDKDRAIYNLDNIDKLKKLLSKFDNYEDK